MQPSWGRERGLFFHRVVQGGTGNLTNFFPKAAQGSIVGKRLTTAKHAQKKD